MTKKEKKAYKSLTVLQKSIIDGLRNIGFKHEFRTTWGKGWRSIDVSKYNSLGEIFEEMYKQGKNEKASEMRKVLELE